MFGNSMHSDMTQTQLSIHMSLGMSRRSMTNAICQLPSESLAVPFGICVRWSMGRIILYKPFGTGPFGWTCILGIKCVTCSIMRYDTESHHSCQEPAECHNHERLPASYHMYLPSSDEDLHLRTHVPGALVLRPSMTQSTVNTNAGQNAPSTTALVLGWCTFVCVPVGQQHKFWTIRIIAAYDAAGDCIRGRVGIVHPQP